MCISQPHQAACTPHPRLILPAAPQTSVYAPVTGVELMRAAGSDNLRRNTMAIATVLMFLALMLFLASTFGVSSRVNLQSAGFACVVLAVLAGGATLG